MDLEEALQEIADLKAKNADMSRNFKAYREIAEKKESELSDKLTETEETLKKEVESTKGEYDSFKKSVEEKEKASRDSFRESKIEEMSKGDKKRAEQLRAEYALLNMPEDSTDAIQARLEKSNSILSVSSPTSPAAAAWAGSGASGGDGSVKEWFSENARALLAFEGIQV